MANVALGGGRNMQGSFANRNHVVMTTGADANRLRVINRGRRHREPGGRERLMAGVAHVAAVNVITTLAAGGHVIVTGDTTARRKR